jgi:hypothetical protein
MKRVLEAILAERGVPQVIRCDNGPELTICTGKSNLLVLVNYRMIRFRRLP